MAVKSFQVNQFQSSQRGNVHGIESLDEAMTVGLRVTVLTASDTFLMPVWNRQTSFPCDPDASANRMVLAKVLKIYSVKSFHASPHSTCSWLLLSVGGWYEMPRPV
jgi:hypothetical protein